MRQPAEKEAPYEILHQIGRGSYASVHKAINRKTGQICAIKKMPVTQELTNLMNEINIMRNCECKNIVQFYGSACSAQEVSIVMEYCCGGSVKDVMRQLDRNMSQDQIVVIMHDVLKGLDYLHSKNKIHRDVKAANILLNQDGIAKIGDFGVSEPLDTSARKQYIIGTLLWLPPEVINQDPNYSPVIDIWSLGITIIEMGDGQPPYSEQEQSAALRKIADLSEPAPSFRDQSAWSSALLDFLGLCLEKDASKRKNASELLTHKIFDSPPSNDIIKDLVAEVSADVPECKEMETNLYRKSECMLKESVILFGIYKERRMRVILVDQMADSLKSMDEEFESLLDGVARREAKLNEASQHLKALLNEISVSEREKNELKNHYDSLLNRKQEILRQLEIVREKGRRKDMDYKP